MSEEMTDDERLRALAALEAVFRSDDDALALLAGQGPGERPLPALLAAYGQHTLSRILLAAFGVDATLDHDETGRHVAEMNSDPLARLVFVLIDNLRKQAALAGDDLAITKLIGAAIINAVGAFTDDHDTPMLLQALRPEVLQTG